MESFCKNNVTLSLHLEVIVSAREGSGRHQLKCTLLFKCTVCLLTLHGQNSVTDTENSWLIPVVHTQIKLTIHCWGWDYSVKNRFAINNSFQLKLTNSLQSNYLLFLNLSCHIRLCWRQLLVWWAPSITHQLWQVTSASYPGTWWDEAVKLMWDLQTANQSHHHPPPVPAFRGHNCAARPTQTEGTALQTS